MFDAHHGRVLHVAIAYISSYNTMRVSCKLSRPATCGFENGNFSILLHWGRLLEKDQKQQRVEGMISSDCARQRRQNWPCGQNHVCPQTVLSVTHALCWITRSRTTLKFWSATMFEAAARNFGPVHKFELPTVIADSVPRATRVFSLASVGHVTGHMVSHMVPMARCRPPYWKIFTVNNLATVF